MSKSTVLVLLLGVVVSACGMTGTTTSYHSSSNETEYETSSITVGRLEAALGSGSRITMHARATCSGRSCSPDRAHLVFNVEGQTEKAIANHSISIEADDTVYSEQSREYWEAQDDVRYSKKQTIVLTLPLSSIEQIANASSVSGRVGNTSVNLGGRAQSHLQEFVRTTRQAGAEEASSETDR